MSAKQVQLRASLIWHDEVMGDVVHDRLRKVTIGPHRKDTFVTPALGLPPRFAILRPGHGGYMLTLGTSMAGRFRSLGKDHDVAEWVRREGEGGGGGDFRATAINPGDWGVIDLDGSGAYQLFFHFVPVEAPVPKHYVNALELLLPALAFSVLFHLILLVVTFRFDTGENPLAWPAPRALTGEYLVTRISPPVPPPSEPAAATAAPAAASKSGDVEKVKSATRGRQGKSGGEGKEQRARDPNAPEDPVVPPQKGLFERGNQRTLNNVIQHDLSTNLDKFMAMPGPRRKGGPSYGRGGGRGGADGDGPGTTRGAKGNGPGGGGSAQGDFQSSGKIDAGETRAPKGPGGGGSGVKEVAVVRTEGPSGDLGGLSKEEIDEVIRRRQGVIRTCYQRELNRTPGIGGKLVVRFTIGADGTVKSTQVNAGKSTLRSDAVSSCVLTQIARLRFPAKGGGVVNYPFIFSQG